MRLLAHGLFFSLALVFGFFAAGSWRPPSRLCCCPARPCSGRDAARDARGRWSRAPFVSSLTPMSMAVRCLMKTRRPIPGAHALHRGPRPRRRTRAGRELRTCLCSPLARAERRPSRRARRRARVYSSVSGVAPDCRGLIEHHSRLAGDTSRAGASDRLHDYSSRRQAAAFSACPFALTARGANVAQPVAAMFSFTNWRLAAVVQAACDRRTPAESSSAAPRS